MRWCKEKFQENLDFFQCLCGFGRPPPQANPSATILQVKDDRLECLGEISLASAWYCRIAPPRVRVALQIHPMPQMFRGQSTCVLLPEQAQRRYDKSPISEQRRALPH